MKRYHLLVVYEDGRKHQETFDELKPASDAYDFYEEKATTATYISLADDYEHKILSVKGSPPGKDRAPE